MVGPWRGLLDPSGFPRRWECGQWSAALGWTHILSDVAIFLAYTSIPLAIAYFLLRRREFAFNALFGLAAAFVLFCGIGHAIEAVIFWYPIYRVAALVKVVTAVISWVAVVTMIRVLPSALKLTDLSRFNNHLRREIQERRQIERELRQSEAEARKLAMIASRTDNAVILTDPHGKIEWVNDGFTRITGYSLEEVRGEKPGALLQGPETDPDAVAHMGQQQRRGEGFQVEIINYSKSGRKYWIRAEAQPIHDDDGRLIHFMAIESDITARKETEARLIALNDALEARVAERTLELAGANETLSAEVAERRRTELALIRRTRVATLAAEVGAALCNGTTQAAALDGCVAALVTHLDAAFARIWTIDKGSSVLVLRASAGQYTHLNGPHGRIPIGQYKIGQIASDRRPYLTNDIARDPRISDPAWASREEMVAFAGFPLVVDNQLVGVMALFSRQQIHQEVFVELAPIADAVAVGIIQKRSEEDLRRSEERFCLATRATNEVIWDWDIVADSVSWSRGIHELIGSRPEAEAEAEAMAMAMDRAWWEGRVHRADSDRMRSSFRNALEGDAQIWNSEYRVDRPDGTSVHVLDRGFILRDPDGRAIRVIGALMDQTQRMQTEVEIRCLNARLEQRLHRLDALRRIDVAISASLDLNLTLGIVLDQVRNELRVDAAAVLLRDVPSGGLSYAAARGFRTGIMTVAGSCPEQGFAGLAVTQQRPISIPDLSRPDIPFVRAPIPTEEGFVGYHAVPLVARGQVQGVLEVYFRSNLDPEPEWLSFLETLAGQAAIAVDNAHLLRDLQQSHAGLVVAYDETIEGWARALDLRDKETEGHTRRVTEMAIRLGRAMGLEDEQLVHMRRGALLHDIGKLGIPDSILLKPGQLTDEEWRVMRLHPGYAYEWLAPISFLKPALDIPYCHHEKWDGTGYPRGLKGEQIPLPARIFAAVDIWDALTSDRPYRRGWPEEKVKEHLASLAGAHLDPKIVEQFLWTLSDAETPPESNLTDRRIEDRFRELQRRLDAAADKIFRLELEGDQLKQVNIELMNLAETDEVTGLKNRRSFHQAVQASFSHACDAGQPLSLIMLDVDHFKSFNDQHGHWAGDGVLRSMAGILREQVRPDDLIARYGGEEFVVILPNADARSGFAIAERLRQAIEAHDWPVGRVTASFGVATSEPEILDAFELLEAADVALYRSKACGRNRVTPRVGVPNAPRDPVEGTPPLTLWSVG